MIKCIAKKKLAFRNPDNKDELITVRPFEFNTLPDWVEKDPMWGWALKDKVIEVSKETIVAVEPKKPPVKKPAKKKPVKKE